MEAKEKTKGGPVVDTGLSDDDLHRSIRSFINFQNAVLDGKLPGGGWLVEGEEEDEPLLNQKPMVLEGNLEIAIKKIAALARTPRYEIYMGYPADDIEAMLEVARKDRLNVVLLDTPEEWGYSFLLVETKKFHLRKRDGWNEPFDIRFNPLEPLELGKGKDEETESEFTISAWDLFPDALSIEDFGYWNKIPEIQWPTEIRLQVSLLTQ